MIKIYYLQDPITKEIRYVGKTSQSLNKRLNGHVYEAKNSKNYHKKFWFENLAKLGLKPNIVLIKEVENNKWELWERFFIKQYRDKGYRLINLKDGGEGFTKADVKALWMKEEYRKHHTERMIGDKNPFFGKHHSDKTKAILRKKCPHRGKNHPNYGKKLSKDIIEKRRLNQPNLKVFLRFDMNDNFIDEWVGLKKMCKILNLDEAAVIRVAKGKNKHHKGFKFKYKID